MAPPFQISKYATVFHAGAGGGGNPADPWPIELRQLDPQIK